MPYSFHDYHHNLSNLKLYNWDYSCLLYTSNTDVVQWSSEDSEIASVDQNGKITAHKGGKTTIKAAIGEFAATCEVTVTIPLESLTIDKLDSAIDCLLYTSILILIKFSSKWFQVN